MSTAQQACNIAGYLAESFIQASIGAAVDQINAGADVVAFGAALGGLLVSLGALSGLLAGAAYILYEDIFAGTLSDYSTARTSATLKGELICAIRGAIAADGAVTSGNFAAVLTAISGIAYLPTAVVTTIHDYVAALGATGLMQVQAVGAMAVYDCTTCSGGWCFTFDFTNGLANAWTISKGTPTAGQGIVSAASSAFEGGTQIVLFKTFSLTFITSVEITYAAPVACELTHPASHFRNLADYPGGAFHDLFMGATTGRTDLINVNTNCNELDIQVATYLVGGTPAAGTNVLSRITVRGTGANPMGTTNCI